MKRKAVKRRIGAVIISASLMMQGMGGMSTLHAADKQMIEQQVLQTMESDDNGGMFDPDIEGSITKEALQDLYEECKSKYQEDNYSADIWAAYQEALQGLENVINSDAATDEDLENAFWDIVTAVTNMEFESAFRNEVQRYYSEYAEHYKEENYPEAKEEWAAYKNALDEVALVLADKNSTLDEIIEIFSVLEEAADVLDAISGEDWEPSDPDIDIPVNKDDLQDIYNECKANYQEDNYSETVWAAYQDALKEAENVLNNDNATEEEIKDAFTSIVTAITAMEVEYAFREEARNYYDECLAKYKEADYPGAEEEWSAYESALEKMASVLADKNSTMDEMMEALTNLSEAADVLDNIGAKEPVKPENPKDPKDPENSKKPDAAKKPEVIKKAGSVATSDNVSVIPTVLMLAVAAAIAEVVYMKKKRS